MLPFTNCVKIKYTDGSSIKVPLSNPLKVSSLHKNFGGVRSMHSSALQSRPQNLKLESSCESLF